MVDRINNGSSSNHDDGSISSTQVWSAAYAGVEVFQQLYNGTAVMRRRKDSYVNVTQILKCAQYDKPHRTRFLEREIHTGIHEKVQGGYGKYQGTWVPLDRAISLAKQLNVYDALKYVLEYSPAPGEKPPTAPRSLESLRKRKSATLKASGPGSATKRRASGTLRRYPSSSSLSSILNKPGDQNMHPAALSQTQPPPSHYYTASNNATALPPATHNTQQLPPPTTPASGAAMSWRADPYTPAPRRAGNAHDGSLASGPSHHMFMTPESPAGNAAAMSQQPPMTPTGNSAAQYQSSFRVSMPDRNSLASPMTRQGPPQATPASAGNAYKTPARALRDISNTYTDMTPAQGYSKVPPPNAKPSSTLDIASSALMTPPPSSSVRRTGAPGNPRSMHTMSPTSMQSTPTAQPATSRPLQPPPPPPVFGHGHYPSNASPLANEIIMPRLGLPNHSAASSPGRANYHMSAAASVTSRPARSYSGSIGSISLSTPNHSRSASTVSQPQEFFGSNGSSYSGANQTQQPPMPSRGSFVSSVMQVSSSLALSVATVLDFLSAPRCQQPLPNVVESVLCDSSFEPNKVTSDDSNTLLHLAIQNGHWDVVQMLVDRGVDPGVMNREGKTPLMIAVQSTLAWQSRSTYTFQWLLDVLGPALVNRDKQGRTAVHWACTRPIDAPANWPDVSLYYTRSLVLKLYQCNNLQVLSWEDYLHRSASQLASLAHLAQVTSLLASACQTPIDPRLIQSLQSLLEIPESRIDNRYKPGKSSVLPPIPPIHQNKNTPQSGTDRPQSAVSGPQRIPSISAIGCNDASVQGRGRLPLSRYDVVTNRAIDIINATTYEMRKEHEAQRKALDDDSEYAAQLLLELSTERDTLKEETAVHEKLAAHCEQIRDQELSLKHRISSVICLQQSARASLGIQPSLTASTTPAVPGSPLTEKASDEDLRSEYLRLRSQANGYHTNSLKLADEYAELASVVKPWPRPPALSLVGMFDDDNDSTLSNNDSLWTQKRATNGSLRKHREVVGISSESADVQAINAALEVDEQRLMKFERVVAAACGDMTLDRVRDVVGPVLSVLNNGNTL